jgi:hypothetical protein
VGALNHLFICPLSFSSLFFVLLSAIVSFESVAIWLKLQSVMAERTSWAGTPRWCAIKLPDLFLHGGIDYTRSDGDPPDEDWFFDARNQSAVLGLASIAPKHNIRWSTFVKALMICFASADCLVPVAPDLKQREKDAGVLATKLRAICFHIRREWYRKSSKRWMLPFPAPIAGAPPIAMTTETTTTTTDTETGAIVSIPPPPPEAAHSPTETEMPDSPARAAALVLTSPSPAASSRVPDMPAALVLTTPTPLPAAPVTAVALITSPDVGHMSMGQTPDLRLLFFC